MGSLGANIVTRVEVELDQSSGGMKGFRTSTSKGLDLVVQSVLPHVVFTNKIANQFPNPRTHINAETNWSSSLQRSLGISSLGSFG